VHSVAVGNTVAVGSGFDAPVGDQYGCGTDAFGKDNPG